MLTMSLSGFGLPSFSGDVKAMQQTMADLAVQRNFPAGNPGGVDGIVGPNTVNALARWAGQLPNIPGAVKTALQSAPLLAVLAPSSADSVYNTIKNYAKEINIGLVALKVYGSGGGGGNGGPAPGGGTPPYVPPPTKPWYQEPKIAVPVGVGSAVALMLVFKLLK